MFLYILCFKVSATFSNFCEISVLQNEFTDEIETMEAGDELNKCLVKFFVSVTKTGGSCYKKTSFLSIRAAFDRHLKAPPTTRNSAFVTNVSLFYYIFSNNHQMNVIIILKQF